MNIYTYHILEDLHKVASDLYMSLHNLFYVKMNG